MGGGSGDAGNGETSGEGRTPLGRVGSSPIPLEVPKSAVEGTGGEIMLPFLARMPMGGTACTLASMKSPDGMGGEEGACALPPDEMGGEGVEGVCASSPDDMAGEGEEGACALSPDEMGGEDGVPMPPFLGHTLRCA